MIEYVLQWFRLNNKIFADSMVFPYFFNFFFLWSDIKENRERWNWLYISHVYPYIMCDTHKQHKERKIQCCKNLGRLEKHRGVTRVGKVEHSPGAQNSINCKQIDWNFSKVTFFSLKSKKNLLFNPKHLPGFALLGRFDINLIKFYLGALFQFLPGRHGPSLRPWKNIRKNYGILFSKKNRFKRISKEFGKHVSNLKIKDFILVIQKDGQLVEKRKIQKETDELFS